MTRRPANRARRRTRTRAQQPSRQRRLVLASVRVFEFWLRARILATDDGAAVTFNAFLNLVREFPEGRRVAAAFIREQGRSAADRARALAGAGPAHSETAPPDAARKGGTWASGGR